MLKKLKQLLITHKILLIALFIFCSGTFVLLDNGKHFSFNLEPYPDGFFYIVPAWNFIKNGDFSMTYDQTTISSFVPPFYSLFLIPIYFLFSAPIAFYFLNFLLGILSIFFVYLFLKENFSTKVLTLVLLYAFLPITLWLPSLPMAENLVLFLIVSILWLWKTTYINKKVKIFLLALLQNILFFTKYSSFTFLIPFNILLCFEFFRKKEFKKLSLYIALCISFLLFFLWNTQSQYIKNVFSPQIETKGGGEEIIAFSLNYVPSNFKQFLNIISGSPHFFLWEKISLFPLGFFLTILFVVFLPKLREKVMKKIMFWELFLIFLGILILQSFFYVLDMRYLIGLLPTFIFLVGLIFQEIFKKSQNVFIGVAIFMAIIFFTNFSFYKKLIATNWLQRSRAWQYEATQHLLSEEQLNDSMIITALPPFLFELYGSPNFKVMPLAFSQEFMNEDQRIWERNIDYENLQDYYNHLLNEEKSLFITNAYITQTKSVIDEFENYKNNFNLELISEGCNQACNIYKLTLSKNP